jgi:hypothetical protein
MQQAEQESEHAQDSAEGDQDRERPPHQQLAAALQALRGAHRSHDAHTHRIVGSRNRPINACRGCGVLQRCRQSWARSAWSAAEPDLVPVGIAVGGLAHTVGVGLTLGWLDSSFGDLGDEGIEVVDEDGVHGVAGMLESLLNEQIPMFRELPHAAMLAALGEA